MYKYIILCLCFGLSGVLCDLNKEEGADCEWLGVKGKCVKETRCLTTLDYKSEEKHLVCSKKGDETIVCCTDCELVNDTRNAVSNPFGGMFWKDGRKARDACLTYLTDHRYRCRDGGFYGGIKRHLNEEKKCHAFYIYAIGGAPPPGFKSGPQFPHQALLGIGENLESAKWVAGASIVSDKYILTAGHIGSAPGGGVKFVAVNVQNRSESPSSWQVLKVKRFIAHPDYKRPSNHHDIGLIETETPIQFSRNVLPACLHVEEVDTDHAIATTWRDLKSEGLAREMADTIQTIELEKFSNEECKKAYASHSKKDLDFTTQVCYGSRTNPTESCKGLSGEPLLVENQFSRCVYAIIGVTSFGVSTCGTDAVIPDVFTRVEHYVPWIDSIVWP